MLTDVSMPGMSGLELVKTIGKEHPSIVPVVLTGYGTIESAVRAIRDGRSTTCPSPSSMMNCMTLERAAPPADSARREHESQEALDTKFGLGSVIGRDYRMAKAFEMIEAVAPSKATVLITGESGTGKSLLARRSIAARRVRRARSWRSTAARSLKRCWSPNCSAMSRRVHRGARRQAGQFLAADGGTIFIDEINSASAAMRTQRFGCCRSGSSSRSARPTRSKSMSALCSPRTSRSSNSSGKEPSAKTSTIASTS